MQLVSVEVLELINEMPCNPPSFHQVFLNVYLANHMSCAPVTVAHRLSSNDFNAVHVLDEYWSTFRVPWACVARLRLTMIGIICRYCHAYHPSSWVVECVCRPPRSLSSCVSESHRPRYSTLGKWNVVVTCIIGVGETLYPITQR